MVLIYSIHEQGLQIWHAHPAPQSHAEACHSPQVLVCACLELIDLDTPSYREFEHDAYESKEDLIWFFQQYLQVGSSGGSRQNRL